MPIAQRLSSPDRLSGQEARSGRPSTRGSHAWLHRARTGENARATILGKGGKIRITPIWTSTARALAALAGDRPPGCGSVFWSRHRKPYTRHGISHDCPLRPAGRHSRRPGWRRRGAAAGAGSASGRDGPGASRCAPAPDRRANFFAAGFRPAQGRSDSPGRCSRCWSRPMGRSGEFRHCPGDIFVLPGALRAYGPLRRSAGSASLW